MLVRPRGHFGLGEVVLVVPGLVAAGHLTCKHIFQLCIVAVDGVYGLGETVTGPGRWPAAVLAVWFERMVSLVARRDLLM